MEKDEMEKTITEAMEVIADAATHFTATPEQKRDLGQLAYSLNQILQRLNGGKKEKKMRKKIQKTSNETIDFNEIIEIMKKFNEEA